ncbi:DUF2380 domain-containing protein [Methylomonas sp. TEB]|uniref:DUF2380 domain-containing protein n=1 Tax=Methylomonas sp. TEB TaxID=3398229 RepID=UPI0039F48838
MMYKTLSSSLLFCLLSFNLQAQTRIAVLDFELKDLTLAPGVPAELQRTASIKPLLEQELARAGYLIVAIPNQAQQADYILIGRLHKPSFLFAYLMGRLVKVDNGRLVGDYIAESKGPNASLTIKAVESLTTKIDHDLERRYSPPPPAKLVH